MRFICWKMKWLQVLDNLLFWSDTMRPICLPLLGEEDADLDGFKMVATGWGKTHDGMFTSNSLVTIITLL